jgi:hypothetical protein
VLAAAVGIDHDVDDLEVVAADAATRKSDDAAAVVRDPPGAAALREVLLEEATRPGGVRGTGIDAPLELGNGVEVVDGHGAQLRVDAGE